MLLTVTEDKATQRCDLSAGTEVSGKGDASASLFFVLTPRRTNASPFLETPMR